MRKTLLATCLLIAASMQAQILYVNNANGTYQAIDTKQAGDITFDQEQRLIDIELLKGGESIIASRFCTDNITNIAPASNQGTELTYDLNPTVTFDATDKNTFSEAIKEVTTDDLEEEYGDFVENYTTTAMVAITFKETGATTSRLPSGVTASIEGGHVVINSTISKVGYVLTGTCSNGSLKIYSTKKFQITANGVNLTNPNGPAINIQSGKTVYFTIVDDKTNTLCDGTTYSAPIVGSDGKEEDQKATLFSEGQIIFDGYKKGTGTLNIKSLGAHAICSDDYIIIRGGYINILEAAKDGIRTKDKFAMYRTETYSPTVTINAVGNGIDLSKEINPNNTTDLSDGTLIIEAGKLDIKSGDEGIKAEYEDSLYLTPIARDTHIKGGYINIVTTNEKSSAIKTSGNYTHTNGTLHAKVSGNGSKIINCDGKATIEGGKITGLTTGTLFADATTTDPTSSGGIKSEGDLTVTGGTIAIECSGAYAKGINSNGNVTIDGGNVTILSTGTFDNYNKRGYAISTNSLTINSGKLVAQSFDETVSATTVTIKSGIFNALTQSQYTGLEDITTQTGGWLLYQKAE